MDFGFWVLDFVVGFGFWVLDFGFWVLGFGFWVLGFGLDFGFWILGFGALGHLLLEPPPGASRVDFWRPLQTPLKDFLMEAPAGLLRVLEAPVPGRRAWTPLHALNPRRPGGP